MRYLAVIHQADGSAFGVSFPDVPGCISGGRTLDIALSKAREALAVHFEGMAEDGDAPPAASDWQGAVAAVLEENADPEALQGFHWVAPGAAEPDRAVRLNITLPQSLVDEIEAHVGERGRSGFLADSARAALDEAAGPADLTAMARAAAAAAAEPDVHEGFRTGSRSIGGPAGKKRV